MKTNIEELKEWREDARRGLKREVEQLREKEERIEEYLRALDATDELLTEVDDLKEELERKQGEIDDLTARLEQKEAETVSLRQQLLEARNQSLEAEVNAKPMEIHNHFEHGSSAQVFNDKVTGKFTKKRRWKRIIKKSMS